MRRSTRASAHASGPPRLSEVQRQGLGDPASCPQGIWSEGAAVLYDPPRHDAVHPEDELQSFAEFEEMGAHEPNEEGTGRWIPTPNRRTVAVLPLHWAGSDGGAPPRGLQLQPHTPATADVVRLCSAFFGLPVVEHPASGDVQLRMIDNTPHGGRVWGPHAGV